LDLTQFLPVNVKPVEAMETYLDTPADKLSPGMRQFVAVKKQHPDCVVLFRMGDFYETFYDDAKLVSKELDIVLTARGAGEKRAPLAGIPYHSLEPNLAKLVKNGHKVAIVEQLEDPKLAKGLVKRGVVRIVTPGMVMEHSMLDERSNNYVMALYAHDEMIAAALCDISTGEFFAAEFSVPELQQLLVRFSPAECIMPASLAVNKEIIDGLAQHKIFLNTVEDAAFRQEKCRKILTDHFKMHSLHGFGIEDTLMVQSSGGLLAHIIETQKANLSYISKIFVMPLKEVMVVDGTTQRNLELSKNMRDQSTKGTLLFVIDKTQTPMGSRLLRKWIKEPLRDIARINQRLDALEWIKTQAITHAEINQLLKGILDIERIISRIVYGAANARDLLALRKSIEPALQIKQKFQNATELLKKVAEMPDVSDVAVVIAHAITDEPPLSVREGGMIRRGYDAELDKLHDIKKNGKMTIAGLEEKEKAQTGIKTLHIKFNNVFGYFIEVSKSQIEKVPAHYIRKQTTANGERYITQELKEQEDLILHAEERIVIREYDLFQAIVARIIEKTAQIQEVARQIALLDVLCSLASVAAACRFVRPILDDSGEIEIKNGRHPVLDQIERFVPNDCVMKKNELMIITGPNMAGKSTFMRQVALIALLAHMGSFVPADAARMSIVDRIFTRVGAADDLASGQSTFMVEMTETANILNNATDKSLIILDEIGRGTSTFDGMSIAWSVAAYIAQQVKAKTLFATHYHMLNKLADEHPNVTNTTVAVKEDGDEVVFLHKIVKGSTDKSYGIHVARLAGMPKAVVEKAVEMQRKLER